MGKYFFFNQPETFLVKNFKHGLLILFLYLIYKKLSYTANVYMQTTDKLMLKNVISTVKWVRK